MPAPPPGFEIHKVMGVEDVGDGITPNPEIATVKYEYPLTRSRPPGRLRHVVQLCVDGADALHQALLHEIELAVDPLQAVNPCGTLLNHMVQYMTTRLDTSFAALSDATRRGVLGQLGRADASITELAEKFHMTLTGMKKHVGVLEQAGLVTTKKVGRVRTCRLGPRRLEEEAVWLERYRRRWDERFDELDRVVEELTRKEKSDERKQRR
jgi:DNA-binding transcriptional ArsR family regulator